MVSAAVRAVGDVLAATLNDTVPGPVPLPPAVGVSHTALVVVVQAQLAGAVTATDPLPATAVNDWLAEYSFFSFQDGASRPVVYVAIDNPHVFKVQPESPTNPTGFHRLTFAPEGGVTTAVRSVTHHTTWQDYRKLWPSAK